MNLSIVLYNGLEKNVMVRVVLNDNVLYDKPYDDMTILEKLMINADWCPEIEFSYTKDENIAFNLNGVYLVK